MLHWVKSKCPKEDVEKLTRNAACKLAGEFRDEAVAETILEWTENNDGPTIFY